MAKLEVGKVLPDFVYDTPFEKGLSIYAKTAEKEKTALIFLRYYGCSICQYDLHQFSVHYNDIVGENGQFLVVLQSDPQGLAGQMEKDTFPYDIICDPRQELYHQFEIAPAKSMGKMLDGKAVVKMVKATAKGIKHGEYEGEELQLPAVFVVDKDNKLTFVHYGKTIGDIPGEAELKALLQ